MEFLLFGFWIAFGIAAFKYVFYGDSSEKMAPILYLVAAALGPLFIAFALLKFIVKGFEWLFKARV